MGLLTGLELIGMKGGDAFTCDLNDALISIWYSHNLRVHSGYSLYTVTLILFRPTYFYGRGTMFGTPTSSKFTCYALTWVFGHCRIVMAKSAACRWSPKIAADASARAPFR